ncbi:hypothetical protein J6590_064727 [Homalodisca vitripennis]|nr:hypothetical protein J6590_064727 [Homalodisca vitripennis]
MTETTNNDQISNPVQKKNVFSVSLKAAKYKASTQDMIHTNISAGDMQMVECGTRFPLQLTNGPPITAKIRKKNESIEDFFSNHIEEYKTPIEDTFPRSIKSMEDLTLQEAGHEEKTKLSDPTDNIDRLSNKLDRLNHFLTTTNPDILVLTEHGLNNNTIKEACLINYILVSAFSTEAHLKVKEVLLFINTTVLRPKLRVLA